jgi:hypothetical protein
MTGSPSVAARGGLVVVLAVLVAMHVVVAAVSVGLLVYWRPE